MAGENTVSTSDGFFKEIYAAALANVVPTSSVLYDIIAFDDSSKQGDSYHQPVQLTNEHGLTLNGVGGTVVTLNDPVNAVMKDGSVQGYEMILRGRVGYAAASRAAGAGKQAFGKLWGTILKNLRVASMRNLEISLLRGQMGIGKVASVSGQDIVITEATWAPTLWAGMEGAVLEAFASQAATAAQHDADITVTSVNFSTRTITVTGTITSVAANDYLFRKGALVAATDTFNEAAGLIKIGSNTGTLFGIAGATYAMWTGNTKSTVGLPTMGRFLDGITLAVEKGGLDEKGYLLVPPRAWEVLNSDLAAARDFDGSYSKEKAENGTQRICYYGQAGEIEVRAHPFLDRGQAVFFPKSAYKRVGSSDVGMGVPGTDGRDVFFHLQDKNAVEARTFSDQALFAEKLATSVLFDGLTYA